MCVVLCDIDKFKVINDTYGHDAGDEVLKFIANIMSASIREQDLVARWGAKSSSLCYPIHLSVTAQFWQNKSAKK
ncbi:MAG: GGDEF domain-containing protein [Paraglaciecola sp.]|nr:GGDEF domain-containing protein [Paraglaciecola sp.]